MGSARSEDAGALVEDPLLRDIEGVFEDRAAAGEALARLLRGRTGPRATVVAIPSGGVPVAVPIAAALELPFDLAVVSKITLPWNTESGCGAVAFDGSVLVDEDLLPYLGLAPVQLESCVDRTRQKIARRMATFAPALGRSGDAPLEPLVAGRDAILVDDGLASGITMLAAIRALRRLEPARVVVAVPTGHRPSLARVRGVADLVVCANVRSGPTFAVASAYDRWCDVEEFEALNLVTAVVHPARGEGDRVNSWFAKSGGI